MYLTTCAVQMTCPSSPSLPKSPDLPHQKSVYILSFKSPFFIPPGRPGLRLVASRWGGSMVSEPLPRSLGSGGRRRQWQWHRWQRRNKNGPIGGWVSFLGCRHPPRPKVLHFWKGIMSFYLFLVVEGGECVLEVRVDRWFEWRRRPCFFGWQRLESQLLQALNVTFSNELHPQRVLTSSQYEIRRGEYVVTVQIERQASKGAVRAYLWIFCGSSAPRSA